MKPLSEILSFFKRSFNTTLDVGPHIEELYNKALSTKKIMTFGLDFENGFSDKIDNHIKIFRFGQYEENRIYMKVVNSKNNEAFYGFVDSPVVLPAMIDRFFGIDMWDAQAVSELYDILTLMYKDKLESHWEYQQI